MQYKINDNGSLTFELSPDEPDERRELQDMLSNAQHKDHGFLADMLEHEGWSTNGNLYPVQPEWIGALTDAPILAENVTYYEDGEVPTVEGRVWWFPGYEVTSFAEELLAKGKVTFDAAPAPSEQETAEHGEGDVVHVRERGMGG